MQDAEAVFAAACANVNAGYFDDPPDLPGLAHFLEHAVHLGSAKYPDEKDYKFFLSRHGGASNASTGERPGTCDVAPLLMALYAAGPRPLACLQRCLQVCKPA